MVTQPRHLIDEVDVGSGEKPPGHRDTEKLIEDLDRPLPGTANGTQARPPGNATEQPPSVRNQDRD